jgi:hypothetical protein
MCRCRALLGAPLFHDYEAHELLPIPLQPQAKANGCQELSTDHPQLRSAWGVFICNGRKAGAGGFTAGHVACLREWGRLLVGPLKLAKLTDALGLADGFDCLVEKCMRHRGQ